MASLTINTDDLNKSSESSSNSLEYSLTPRESRGTATSVESFFDDELTSGEDEDSEDEFVDARALSEEINKTSPNSNNNIQMNNNIKIKRPRLSSFEDEPTLYTNGENGGDDNEEEGEDIGKRRPTTPAELLQAISELDDDENDEAEDEAEDDSDNSNNNNNNNNNDYDGEEDEDTLTDDLPEGHFYLTKIGDDGKKYTVVARSNAFGEIIPIHTSPHSPKNKGTSKITSNDMMKTKNEKNNNNNNKTTNNNTSPPSTNTPSSKKKTKSSNFTRKHNRASTATAVLGDVDELRRNLNINKDNNESNTSDLLATGKNITNKDKNNNNNNNTNNDSLTAEKTLLHNATSSMGNLWRRFRRKSVYSNDIDIEAVPVKTFKKKSSRYNALHLRQTLKHHTGRICVMAFNNPSSGEPLLLATAGEDSIINVWELNTNRELRSFQTSTPRDNNGKMNKKNTKNNDNNTNNKEDEDDSNKSSSNVKKNSTLKFNIEPHEKEIPAFNDKPLRQFKGHSKYVISLSWNKGFLLSGSLDKTARLWHIKKEKCLVSFKHHGAVTAVAYHPFNIDVFVTGSFDSKLRMWSISKKKIILFKQTLGPISAVSFNPSGKMIAVGLLDGICLFYHHAVSHKTSSLQYHTQIECRNRRGKFRTGRKVSGFVWRKNGEELLISTNDSRIRLIRMRDYNPFMKFKGAILTEAPITASFNESGTYVICGSEDGRIVIWTTEIDQSQIAISLKAYKNKNYSYESFQGSNTVTTCAMFGPSRMARDVGCVGWEREMISTRYVKDIEDDCRFILVGDLEGHLRIFEQRTKYKMKKKR